MTIRQLLLTISIPIQKFMQKLHPPYAQTTVAQAEQVMKIMEDGDILLSNEAWHFTNLFIEGFWSHAAIFGQGRVVEAVAPKVQEVDFRDWVIEKHNWVVLRVPHASTTWGHIAYKNACTFIDALYDYLFEDGNKEQYCSGMVREAYPPNVLPESLAKLKTILPEHFYQAALRGELIVVHEHRDK